MKVDRIDIQAYRSLYDISFTPHEFCVLVGPNNAGKSNVMEALDFLAEVHRHGLESALIRKGGLENIAHRKMRRTRTSIRFEVTASLDHGEITQRSFRPSPRAQESRLFNPDPYKRRLVIRHSFSVKAVSRRLGNDFIVDEEQIEISDEGGKKSRKLWWMKRNGMEVEFSTPLGSEDSPKPSRSTKPEEALYPLNSSQFLEFALESLEPTSLFSKTLFSYSSAGAQFSDGLASSKLYQLSPYECRRPGVSSPNADVDVHGANLPALVAHMSKHYPDSWKRVMKAMRQIIPGLEDIRTDFTHDRRLYLEFRESGIGRAWTSEDVSDGTVQALALFTALYDPRSAMALMEEPENSVHPWIIRAYVEACREVSNKQVIVTTHSPVLIEYLEPHEIFVVWRDQGETVIESLVKLDPGAAKSWQEGKVSLFELLDSGLLSQSVPAAFNPHAG